MLMHFRHLGNLSLGLNFLEYLTYIMYSFHTIIRYLSSTGIINHHLLDVCHNPVKTKPYFYFFNKIKINKTYYFDKISNRN